MKAMLLEATGERARPRLCELPPPVLREGEALVDLRAAALNHRDLWICKGQYAGIRLPIVLGSDGAGVVAQGPSDWLGRDVIINPSFGWGESERAQGAGFRILGLPDQGTLADQIAVSVSQLRAKPKHLNFAEAAALPLAGLTAFRALFSRAQLKPGERLLVTGVGGGVALLALLMGRAAGAHVWVTSGSDAKIRRAQALGAAGGALYGDADWPRHLLDAAGTGFDVIVDSAGGPDFERLIDLAQPGGRLVFFGATRGQPHEFPTRKVFWRQLTLLGTTMGSPSDFEAMTDFVEKHGIVPVIDRTAPLEEVPALLDAMDSATQFGKLVATVS